MNGIAFSCSRFYRKEEKLLFRHNLTHYSHLLQKLNYIFESDHDGWYVWYKNHLKIGKIKIERIFGALYLINNMSIWSNGSIIYGVWKIPDARGLRLNPDTKICCYPGSGGAIRAPSHRNFSDLTASLCSNFYFTWKKCIDFWQKENSAVLPRGDRLLPFFRPGARFPDKVGFLKLVRPQAAAKRHTQTQSITHHLHKHAKFDKTTCCTKTLEKLKITILNLLTDFLVT